MKQPKEGSLWWAGNDKRFRVMSVIELDGNTWVHYREELKGLHDVRSTIGKRDYTVILPDHIIERCNELQKELDDLQ